MSDADRMQYVVRDFYTDIWIAFDTEDEAQAECAKWNEGVNNPGDKLFVTPWPAEATDVSSNRAACDYCHGEGEVTGSVTPYGTQMFDCPACKGTGHAIPNSAAEPDCTCRGVGESMQAAHYADCEPVDATRNSVRWWERRCRKVISFTYADETRCNLRRGHEGACRA